MSALQARAHAGRDPVPSTIKELSVVSIHAPTRGATYYLQILDFKIFFLLFPRIRPNRPALYSIVKELYRTNLVISVRYIICEPPWELMSTWGSQSRLKRSEVLLDQFLSWLLHAQPVVANWNQDNRTAGCLVLDRFL